MYLLAIEIKYCIIPLAVSVETIILDRLIKRHESLLNFANLIVLFNAGMLLVFENLSMQEFRVYEMWIVFHFLS